MRPATPNPIFSAYLCRIQEGDRRGSNPRPSEPQSDDIGGQGLLRVAESPYLRRFLCWRLLTVAACCALTGVKGGAKRYRLLPYIDPAFRTEYLAAATVFQTTDII